MIMEAGRSQISRAVMLVTQGEADVMWWFTLEVHLGQNFFLLRGGQFFVLLGFSTDWMKSTHIVVCFTQVHWFTCKSHPKNTLAETSGKMFDQIAGHHGLAKLTQEIITGVYGLIPTGAQVPSVMKKLRLREVKRLTRGPRAPGACMVKEASPPDCPW